MRGVPRRTRKPKPVLVELSPDDVRAELKRVLTIADVELMVLKAHLLLEAALMHLVTARLNTTKSALPRLQFAQLSALALAGIEDQFVERTRRLVANINTM